MPPSTLGLGNTLIKQDTRLPGLLDKYPADPHFYLNFDEPHDVPKRIKDGWQRGTEATYWDGEKLRTAAPHEPRVQVDPETGERYLLAEPQRTRKEVGYLSFSGRTNYVDLTQNATTAPDGTNTGIKAEDIATSGGSLSVGFNNIENNTEGRTDAVSVFVKAGSLYTFQLSAGGGNTHDARLNVDLSEESLSIDGSTYVNYGLIKYGDWYRAWLSTKAPGADTGGKCKVELNNSTQGDYLYVWGNQIEYGAAYPTSLIKGPSNTTRAPDDLSDLPFSMQSGAKSVYFRISQEANAYAPNEGGNVTNAETNLTDSPGTAGGGMLRPSTGILGISASGWIDAVVNSTDEDLQGNSTSDVVDGLTIQPDKSPSTDGAIYRIYELVAWEEERAWSERRTLVDERPHPYQPLDGPSIADLNDPSPWDQYGLEPPHYHVDINEHGLPAKWASVVPRGTTAYKWDGADLVIVQPGEPRVGTLPDGRKGYYAEKASTNEIPYSCDPTQWASAGADGVALSGASSIFSDAGSNSLINPQEVSAQGSVDDRVQETSVNSDVVLSQFVLEKGTADVVGILIYDVDNGSVEYEGEYDFTTDSLNDITDNLRGERGSILRGTGPNGGEVAVLSFRGSPSTKRFEIRPDVGAGTGSTYVHYMGSSENVSMTGTPIVTDAGSVSREDESLTMPWLDFLPYDEGTMMLEFFESRLSNHLRGCFGSDNLSSNGTQKWTINGESFDYIGAPGGSKYGEYVKLALSWDGSEIWLSLNGASGDKKALTSSLESASFTLHKVHFTDMYAWPQTIQPSTLDSMTL